MTAMTTEKLAKETYWTLKLVYGVVPIVAGLDKFTNLLVDWTQYLSPLATAVVPISPKLFMMIVGVVEIAAGLLVLSKFTRLGAWVVCAWLAAIALNLLTTGSYFDIAVRDLVLAVGAFRLARTAQVVEPLRQERPHRAPAGAAPAPNQA